MKRYILLLILISLTLYAQENDPDAIMKKMDKLNTTKDLKTQMVMSLVNKRNQKRVRKVKSYRKGTQKQIIWFLEPADIKGTSFLRIETDGGTDKMYLYLPAFKRVRRITGAQKNENFMGSDLTYNDMSGIVVEDYKYKLKKEMTINDRLCYVVEAVPKPSTDIEYNKIIYYIWKEKYKPLKTEYYIKNKLEKIMTFGKYVKVKNYLLAESMTMENVRKKHKTILEFQNMEVDTGISERIFTMKNLKKIR